MNIHTVRNFATGRLGGITNGSGVPIWSSGIPLRVGLTIMADSGNTGAIFCGNQGVTVNSSFATDGFPIMPGTSFTFPIDNASGMFFTSNMAAAQKLWWFGA